MPTVKFEPHEHTRLFATDQGDQHLCKTCAENAKSLGVPGCSMAIMMGMRAWPTGKEPCDRCEKSVV